ncbi:reduced folate transporter isoform X2 [Protopterus annectens]|uniref:reduced folate transporter isoform X2 n=1 Tax=Protopterus annectens TaxID=7888 RepID=UPI001CF9BD4C|nr:reduced folate transporter isoform X2 [Protopterus annectens]
MSHETKPHFLLAEVTNEITPILSYSYMAVLVPVFLLTDFLRYKPILIVQSISHVIIWLLLIFGTNIISMQFMEFFYGVTMAARVAYSSYIFSLVSPARYQRVASYSRSSVLMGVFTSCILGQLCVSIGGVPFLTLNYISLGFVSFGLILALFLRRPKRSLFFNRISPECNGGLSSELKKMNLDDDKMRDIPAYNLKSGGWRNSAFVQMLKQLVNFVKLPQLRLWSLWWIFNSAGYYLILYFVQILWHEVYPAGQSQHVYNGGVDAGSTLLGAIAAFGAGYIKINWKLWAHLMIGVITALQAGLLYLMNSTNNIWLCYASYILFRSSYQFLVPIAIFQIAASLTKELCALVFGINTFLATVLKSIITLVVADKRVLGLSVHPQFYVYFTYFTILAVAYLGAAVYVLTTHHCKQRREGTTQNELWNQEKEIPKKNLTFDEDGIKA